MRRQIATLFGIGHLPMAPGTWASAIAIPITWALHALGGFAIVALATVGVVVVGLWAIDRLLPDEDADPSEFVIDELAGMMVTLWPLSFGLTLANADPGTWPYPGWIVGFLLFRAFDIFKPRPIDWADRQKGALGIMLDDLLAGAMAAVLISIAAIIAHV